MSIAIDVRVPPNAFELGRILEGISDVEVEFDRVVPRGISEAMPILLVQGDFEAFEQALRSDNQITNLTPLDETERVREYHLQWSPPHESLLQAIIEANAIIVDGRKRGDDWAMRLRFQNQSSVD